VPDVPPVARWYTEALRRPGWDLERPEIDAAGVRFTVGSHTLDFVAPRGSAGPLTEWLVARGASPYAATFRGPTPGTLDPANTLGARLTLVA